MKSKNYVFPSLFMLLALSLNACGSSNNSPAPVYSATPIALPSVAPFSESFTTSLTDAPQTVTIPSISGYSGSVAFGTPTVFTPGTTLNTTFGNIAPSTTNAPTLASFLRAFAEKRALAAGATSSSFQIAVLTYTQFLVNNFVEYSKAPSFVLTVPSDDIVSADYYIAAYDPSRPSLGWQLAFEGPATVSGDTLTFSSSSVSPFTFYANAYYYFASFAISKSATQPTPAPSVSPIAPATISPSATPVPDTSEAPVPDTSTAP